MKRTFSIAISATLTIAAAAQPPAPPPITSAPPPLNPNLTPAAPQPGIATDATGASAFNPFAGSGGTVRGRSNISAPFPVVVPQGAFPPYIEPFDPFAVVDLYHMLEAPPPPV